LIPVDVDVSFFPRRILELPIFADLEKPIGSALVGIEGDVPDVRVVVHGEDGEIDTIVEPVRMIRFGCEGLVNDVGQCLG
jgi:hypothetical protein